MRQKWPKIRQRLRRSCTFLLVCLGLLANSACRRSGLPAEVSESFSAADTTSVATGKDLFGNYCAQCHGDKGDGNGPAAKFLYPRPRNFGEAKFRIVSTANGMPSDKDLLQVLNHGMPGSAMFPFAHLSQDEKGLLLTYVRQLEKDLLIEHARADSGENVDIAELGRDVDQLIQPAADIPAPAEVLSPHQDSIVRGKQLYQAAGCVSCHGKTGKGDGVQEQRDTMGMPIHPRDFTRGIFKGGREPQQLYARIALGMPGSPMPASPQLKPEEIGDLVNFVLSLSDPLTQAKVEHTRVQLAAQKTAALSDSISDAQWDSATPTSIVVSPLWWREYAEPNLQVRALHDGKTLAIRLQWADGTRDDSPVRPQDFMDMVAVQLFKGKPEPFLGMGMTNKSVDVWLWRADLSNVDHFADVETAYLHMYTDLYPFERTANGPSRHAIENQSPEFITARAAGNLRSSPAFSGNSLEAKGFGTLTMRPKISQLVSGSGKWADGKWTVVLRRPLEVPPDAGLTLGTDDRLSIAFALWDGAARDRNGQKLVSIWHDLRLEQ